MFIFKNRSNELIHYSITHNNYEFYYIATDHKDILFFFYFGIKQEGIFDIFYGTKIKSTQTIDQIFFITSSMFSQAMLYARPDLPGFGERETALC